MQRSLETAQRARFDACQTVLPGSAAERCATLRVSCSAPGTDLTTCSLNDFANLSPNQRDTVRVQCEFDDRTISSCPLGQPWRGVMSSPNTRVKRGAWEAFAQWSLHQAARQRAAEAVHHQIDLEHRKALDATRTSVTAMALLVSSPVDELAAYHAAGITPQQIADLAVQALGMAGIAVGASQ